MALIKEQEKKCPHCGSSICRRVRRPDKLIVTKLLPTSRIYECQECYGFFMSFFGKIIKTAG